MEVLAQERRLFEIDHCEAGRRLATDWKLPDQFLHAIARHHVVKEDNGAFDLLTVIRLACRMADTIGFAAAPCLKCCSYEQLRSEVPERVRDLIPQQPEDLSFRIATKINSIESVY